MSKKVKHMTLGYSTLSAWRKCPMYFKHRYLDSLEKPSFNLPAQEEAAKGSPLTFGSVIHDFLEDYHGTELSSSAALEKATADATEKLGNVKANADRSAEHAIKLMTAYAAAHPQHTDFKPVKIDGVDALEHEYDLELLPGVTWRVHFDGLVRAQRDMPECDIRKGDIVILEHKTASDLLYNLRSRMFSDQAIGYSYVATQLLFPGQPVKVLFNGLCTRQSSLKGLDPEYSAKYVKRYGKEVPPLFYRETVNVKEWQHVEWVEQVSRDIARLKQDIEEGKFSRNAPDACTVFNRMCQFSTLCQEAPETRGALAETIFEKGDWHGWEAEYEKD